MGKHLLEAAHLAQSEDIHWTLVGSGQQDAKVRAALNSGPASNLDWVEWIPQPDLIDQIHNSDICLGIFGTSSKASRVIPNKVYEVIASGKPLVTRDSPAIRELLSPGMLGIRLVEAGNPQALLEAVRELGSQGTLYASRELHLEVLARITPEAIGTDLLAAMEKSGVI